MPERILRDYTTSDKFDGFAGSPETLFTRLLTKVDDYGRLSADPVNVRGACYPRAENLRANTVAAWLNELSGRRLLLCYQVLGKPYLAIVNFRQRLKAGTTGRLPSPKCPPPEGKDLHFRPDDGDWKAAHAESGGLPEVPAKSGEIRPYSKPSALPNAGAGGVSDGNSSLLQASSGGSGGGGSEKVEVGGQRSEGGARISAGTLREVALRIVNNSDGWHYDNVKVPRNGFTLRQVETVLHPFLGAVTANQVRGAWQESVTLTHQAVVDVMPMEGNPEGYCVGLFKIKLKERAAKNGIAVLEGGSEKFLAEKSG